ncbi:NAD(P)-dependent oxidoreductase [Deltaproteobacteria bacterium TL4]
MRILVAGASGYLGGRVASHLAQKGHEVMALDRQLPTNSEAWQKQMNQLIIGDVLAAQTLQLIFDTPLDAVIYTISLNHKQSEVDVERTLATNVSAMWKIAEGLASKGLKRFVYFSTQQVYGKLASENIRESHPTKPVNNYGLTHLMCENVAQLLSTRTPTKYVNLRLSNGFGAPLFPHCDCWWLVINDFCKTAIEQKKIQLLSDGTPQRDFVPIKDLCQALELVIQAPDAVLEHPTFNLGGGKTYTMLELAHIVAQCYQAKFQQQIPVILPGNIVSENADSHQNIKRFQYDIERLKAIGYKPESDLKEGIFEVFDFINNVNL